MLGVAESLLLGNSDSSILGDPVGFEVIRDMLGKKVGLELVGEMLGKSVGVSIGARLGESVGSLL